MAYESSPLNYAAALDVRRASPSPNCNQLPPPSATTAPTHHAEWQRGPQLARLQLALEVQVAGAQQRPPSTPPGEGGGGEGGRAAGGAGAGAGVGAGRGRERARSPLSSLNSAAWERMGLPGGWVPHGDAGVA